MVLKERALQKIVDIVMEADSDGNFDLDAQEIDKLCLALSLVEDFVLDEENFRQRIVTVKSFTGILSLVKDLLEKAPDSIAC